MRTEGKLLDLRGRGSVAQDCRESALTVAKLAGLLQNVFGNRSLYANVRSVSQVGRSSGGNASMREDWGNKPGIGYPHPKGILPIVGIFHHSLLLTTTWLELM